MAREDMTIKHWLEALRKTVETEDGSSDAMTAKELSNRLGISLPRTREFLRTLLAQGQLKVTERTITNLSGRTSVVPAYILYFEHDSSKSKRTRK